MTQIRTPPATTPTGLTYASFAVFGGFWGAWGASIPAIRDQTGVTVGELGTALLFVGVGALPAMLLTGRALDRWGPRVTALTLLLLGVIGLLVAITARDLSSLSVGLTAVGASSGAADVAINTAAGAAQQASGTPVIGRAHGAFSLAVVVTSLLTGVLRDLGAPLLVPYAIVAVGAAVAAVALATGSARTRGGAREVRGRDASRDSAARRVPVALGPLLVLGILGAVALAVENGHQSWSALFLHDVLDAGATTAAGGPAVFAAVVALTRVTASGLSTRHSTAVLVTGSVVAATGTAIFGAAPTVVVGLVGLGVAAAGTAVLFPTLLTVLSARVPERARGRATSVVTTIAYLGFLAGPVYVGRWADAIDLRGAMFALAALAAVLAGLMAIGLRGIPRAPAGER